MDERIDPRLDGGFGHVSSAVDVGRVHSLAEGAAKVDRGGRALQRFADGDRLGDVRLDEAELPDLSQRLDKVGVAGIAARHPHSNAAPEQIFAYVPADESIAA